MRLVLLILFQLVSTGIYSEISQAVLLMMLLNMKLMISMLLLRLALFSVNVIDISTFVRAQFNVIIPLTICRFEL